MSESFQEISQEFTPMEGVSLQIKTSEPYIGSSVVTPDPNSGVLLEGSVIQISESGVLSVPTTGNTVQITENSYVQLPDLTGINLVSAETYVSPQSLMTETASSTRIAGRIPIEELPEVLGVSLEQNLPDPGETSEVLEQAIVPEQKSQ